MMTRKLFHAIIIAGVVGFLLIIFLFADRFYRSSSGFIGSSLKEIVAVFRDSDIQWVVFGGFGIYLICFFFIRFRAVPIVCQAVNPTVWIAYFLLISVVLYGVDYSASIEALTLLGGAVLGQGFAVWAAAEIKNSKCRMQNDFDILVISMMLILLTFASICPEIASNGFNYRGHLRWIGPWYYPNTFGLLMGAGMALALGGAVSCFNFSILVRSRGDENQIKEKSEFPSPFAPLCSDKHVITYSIQKVTWFIAFLCFLAAILMGRGLLHSYSRGAWVGAVCGLVYLTVYGFSVQGLKFGPRIRNNGFFLTIIAVSVFVLSIWHFQQTDSHVIRRVSSVANQNDLSWRNRVAAWEGDLQMMAEHPWFGMGWNQSEPFYGKYYALSRLDETAAIQMNDYLMLGATLGIPALFCFGMYLWMAFSTKFEIGKHPPSSDFGATREGGGKFEIGDLKLEMAELAWLKTVCRAGALVLAVGFWFDGGLFKLPTAATFWILLELGREA